MGSVQSYDANGFRTIKHNLSENLKTGKGSDYGLTSTELEATVKIWNLFRSDLEATGKELFVRFFSKYPHNKKYFAIFNDQNDNLKLPNFFGLDKLSCAFIRSINIIVYACENNEYIYDKLVRISKYHKHLHIPDQSYLELKDCFVWIVKHRPDVSSKDKETWQLALTLLFNFLITYDEMNISQAESDIIKKAWTIIKKDANNNNNLIWTRFFQLNPNNKDYFSFAKDLNSSELLKHDEFISFVNQFMAQSSNIVDNLLNTDKLDEIIQKQIAIHSLRRVSRAAYTDLKTAIIKSLDLMLGTKGSADIKQTFDKILRIIFLKMIDASLLE